MCVSFPGQRMSQAASDVPTQGRRKSKRKQKKKEGDDAEDAEQPAAEDTGEKKGGEGEEVLGEEVEEEEEEEEEEGEWEEEEEEEEEEVFVSSDYISSAFLSEDCTIPENILEFQYSYGYDCLRFYNLCVIEADIVAYASGNLIHFYNLSTGELWFRPSAKGGGIGAIAKSPTNPHIAVGEKGENSHLIIYEWPSMEIVCVLRGGTSGSYTALCYSPDGETLCSQSGRPDYLLTLWIWQKRKILRQQKAFINDIFSVQFSPYHHRQLITGGVGHMKYWNIVNTFTGLKLLGTLGRFGKMETSDIVGFVFLPDEQVVSGTDWGNFFYWREQEIRLHVCRRNKSTCHTGPIYQILHDKGEKELYTIGTDGYIKVWDMLQIERAALRSTEEKMSQVEAFFVFDIVVNEERAKLMYVVKCCDDPSDLWYFAQDGNGGIWKLELRQSYGKPPVRLKMFHGGAVIDIVSSPYDTHIATLGKDARIIFYNYTTRQLILYKQFPIRGCCMVWLPLHVEPTGNVLVVGFVDGAVRVLVVSLQDREKHLAADKELFITLIQVTKPHTAPVTKITVNPTGSVLVTGSEDKTVFVYQITHKTKYVTLVPIGYVNTPSPVIYLSWKPDCDCTLLGSCSGGHVIEMELPQSPCSYTTISYELKKVDMRLIEFKSVKSQIRQDLMLLEIQKRKAEKLELKKEKLQQMKKDNPYMVIDTEAFLEDSESTIELEPLYIPPVPNPIFFVKYVAPHVLWLSPGGFDAGYMYEYEFGKEGPVCSTMIADADDVEIHCYIDHPSDNLIILGMQDGKIRVCRTNPSNYNDLSDYWCLSMHDIDHGTVTKMCFSYDYKYMFSIGNDGNIFSYIVNPDKRGRLPVVRLPEVVEVMMPRVGVEDILDPDYFSLEQFMVKAEHERRMAIIEGRKEKKRAIVKSYQKEFQMVIKINNEIPKDFRVTDEEMDIGGDVREAMKAELDAKWKAQEHKYAFKLEKSKLGLKRIQEVFYSNLECLCIQVCGIREKWRAYTFRHVNLGERYYDAVRLVGIKVKEAKLKGRLAKHDLTTRLSQEDMMRREEREDAWIRAINRSSPEVKKNILLCRVLDKYMARKEREEARRKEWNEMYKKRPDPKKFLPQDVFALDHARRTIGDFKLKSDPNYHVPRKKQENVLKKFQQVLQVRKLCFDIKDSYNRKVLGLRSRKKELVERFTVLHAKLKTLQGELEEKDRLVPPPIPVIDWETEYPELLDQLHRGKPEDTVQQDPGKADSESSLDTDYELLLANTEDSEDMTRRRKRKDVKCKSVLHVEHALDDDSVPTEGIIKGDDMESPWESEFRYLRTNWKRFERDSMMTEMESSIVAFDKEVRAVAEERHQVAVLAKLNELNLLKLYRELLKLTDFEAKENYHTDRVNDRLQERNAIFAKIESLQKNIDSHRGVIEDCAEKQRLITNVFLDSLGDNKYTEFLKKIFRRKYKPPRIKSADESDEESSSSSDSEEEEEGDTGSFNSREMLTLQMDENTCPEDLERELYDLTFKLRADRHVHEKQVMEEKKIIDALKKEIEVTAKKIKGAEANLKVAEQELQTYQTLKQHVLNEVEVVVLLHASQLQFFEDRESSLNDLGDKLVFSNSMLKRLKLRITELEKETEIVRDKYREYKGHFKQMRIDCKAMNKVISDLKAQLIETMMARFGRKISIDELDRALMRRLLGEMRSAAQELQREYDAKLQELAGLVRDREENLARIMQENTEKVNVLAALESKKLQLQATMTSQEGKKHEVSQDKRQIYKSQVQMLSRILRHQKEEMDALKKEIHSLSCKGKPPPSPIEEKLPSSSSSVSLSDEEEEFLWNPNIDINPTPRKLYPQEDINDMYRKEQAIKDVEATLLDILNVVCSPERSMRAILNEIIDSLGEKEASLSSTELVQGILHEIIEELVAAQTAEEIGVPDLLAEILNNLHSKEDLGSEEIAIVQSILHDCIRMAVEPLLTEPESEGSEAAKEEEKEVTYEEGGVVADKETTPETTPEVEDETAKEEEKVVTYEEEGVVADKTTPETTPEVEDEAAKEEEEKVVTYEEEGVVEDKEAAPETTAEAEGEAADTASEPPP